MKVIGLTGGVGMGKTTAAKLLEQRRIPVIDTDVLARWVVEPRQPAFQEVVEAFGARILASDGTLDRGKLAGIIFSDTQARHKLEDITHPRIREIWRKQIDSWKSENHPAAVVIIPLLFETAAERELDAVVCVACTAGSQHRRLAERGWSAEQIRQRISAQWPVEKKIALSDFVAWSEGELDVMSQQLDRILRFR